MVQNQVTLIGNVGQDPTVYDLENGGKLIRFSLATNEYYKNQKGERVTETMWHNCIAFGKLAELAETLIAKGRKVALSGKIRYSEYKDKDGIERRKTDIVVSEFQMMDRQAEPDQADTKQAPHEPVQQSVVDADDTDLPF